MWFPLGIQNLIFKKIVNDHYEIYISDFMQIWHSSLSNDELVSVCKRLNPLFEASVQKLKEIISNLFQDYKTEKEISQESNSITLKLKSIILGVKFMFEVVLHKQNEEIFYKEFTLPLLFVLVQMHNREKKLIKIITDKDAEIKEYKEECGSVKFNHAATEPFNQEIFESQESVSHITDINSFIECVQLKVACVKKEMTSCDKVDVMCLFGFGQSSITDTKESNFKNKNGSKQCVKMENQMNKRRRKQSDAFKIKF